MDQHGERKKIVIDLNKLRGSHGEDGGPESSPRNAVSVPTENLKKAKVEKSLQSTTESVATQGKRAEDGLAAFRLRGKEERIHLGNPALDHMIEKQKAAEDIRQAEVELHNLRKSAPEPISQRNLSSNADIRAAKARAAMSLNSLFAIHHAYEDRKRVDKARKDTESVSLLKALRDSGRKRVEAFKEDRRNGILVQRAIDHEQLQESMESRYTLEHGCLLQRNVVRRRLSENSHNAKADISFVQDFSAQNNVIANALLRHDRRVREKGDSERRSSTVSSYKATEDMQREAVRHYLQRRTTSRQNDSARSRAALHHWLLQDSTKRVTRAKQRVLELKSAPPAGKRSPSTVLPAINYTIAGQRIQPKNVCSFE